jgi:hypothetical protein
MQALSTIVTAYTRSSRAGSSTVILKATVFSGTARAAHSQHQRCIVFISVAVPVCSAQHAVVYAHAVIHAPMALQSMHTAWRR